MVLGVLVSAASISLLIWSVGDSLLHHVSCGGYIVRGLHSVFLLAASSRIFVGLPTGLGLSLVGLVCIAGERLSEFLLSASAVLILLSASELLALSTTSVLLLTSAHGSSFGDHFLASDLLFNPADMVSLELLLVSGDSLLDLLLGSPDDIVNLGSNLLDLLLPVEALSDLLISLDEAFELLLEAVVLIVEICHMLIEGIHFGLQINLVSHHLL